MKFTTSSIAIGIVATTLCSAAVAQTTNDATDHPTAIGTSQQTADDASRKAAAAGNPTMSLVRTGPSAGDKASEAVAAAKDKTDKAVSTTKTKAAHTKNRAKADTDADADASTTTPPATKP